MNKPQRRPFSNCKAVFLLLGHLALLSGCSVRPGKLSAPVQGLPTEKTGIALDVANAGQQQITRDVERTSEAMHHFMIGQLSLVNEDFKEALSNFEDAAALSVDPAPIVYIRIAELQLRFGDLKAAEQAARKAYEQDPKNSYINLLYAGVLENRGKPNEAEPVYRGVIAEEPLKIEPYILLSSSYLRREKTQFAIDVLKEGLARLPNEVLLSFYLGSAYEKAQDFESARLEYERVVSRDPARITGAAELLRVYIKTKRTDEAKRLCESILAKDSNNTLARKMLGHLMLGESNFDEALRHLQVVETLEEDASDTRFKIALIQLEKQNFREALRELSLVLAKNPDHHEARYYLASIYAGAGDRKESVRELRRIPEGSPIFVKSRSFLAFVLRQDNKLSEALAATDDALKIEPTNTSLVLYKVMILRDRKNFSAAEEFLKNQLSSDPFNSSLLFNLALIKEEMGKPEESIQLMEGVIVSDPNNSDALNYIAYAISDKPFEQRTSLELDRAEFLIRRALSIRPGDGYYLDTLGWIQVQRSSFAEAEKTLKEAVEASGNDPVVVEHLIAALIQQKKLKEAVIQIRTTVEEYDARQGELNKADEESVTAYRRLSQTLENLLRQNPNLALEDAKSHAKEERKNDESPRGSLKPQELAPLGSL